MKIKDVVKTLMLSKKKISYNQLYTKWGEELDTDHILEEYPRPQLKRDNYTILNGYWKYCITKKKEKPVKFDGKILVPFSPESTLSGVMRNVTPSDYLWYERVLPIDKIPKGKRCILLFGAVDQYCEVFINNNKIKRHIGGYLPFSVDITKYITEGNNTITVRVMDLTDSSYHSRGKQVQKRGGMFYTAQSGIWQTVWMEWVPEQYIKSIKITPSVDNCCIQLEIFMNHWEMKTRENEIRVDIYENQKLIESIKDFGTSFIIPIKEPKLWSPENPFLYDMIITVGEDRVESYFAMRKFEVKQDEEGVPRLFLNNKAYFHNGVLDQGYWPDGLYTAPSDEAFIYDIQKTKELGFNMLRKHIKIEPLRWYYHCDRLGVIVWQDMVNGGGKYNMIWCGYLPTLFPKLVSKIKDNCYYLFSRANKNGRKEWCFECKKTVELLYNCPSIAVWVTFNEGWGQFDAVKAVELIRGMDKTRLIDQASGWFDQMGGDFSSVHNYFRKLDVILENRAAVLSEFAGFVCYIPRHSFSKHIYGYKIYVNKEQLNDAVQKLYNIEIKKLIKKGLSATVFTQLSDVEDEVNGIMTYDRKICKITRIDVPQLTK
ncbi:glycoside hydrolase family 2 protein [Anaerocolumna sp. MB42-C2]|uniref:glycoside hydrolase family 2 protein n=1 Tax=Anaerocolumna sp. MB42-C2 TaxID=3070997 RepID=UPI0027E1AFAE|nr:sugar-binding domain-containing protein [Anaerocolumna sp. MB42-C2]WMJ86542.1 glycoside hydrolase family 2 [Anaerocolumna sp. MB42-C2]